MTQDNSLDFGTLLAEAKAQQADTERLKEGRKALKEGRKMPSAEYETLLGDIKRIEAVREWRAVADVALFQVQHCQSCDNYLPLFTGLFQRQRHRNMRDSSRWIAATASENRGLPKEIKTNTVSIPFCHFCIEEHGYPIEQLGIEFDIPETASEFDTEAEEELSPEEAAQLEFEAEADENAESLQLFGEPTDAVS